MSEKLDFPATRRNRDAIGAVLKRWLADADTVLEIASGSGQHAVTFAAQLTRLRWQPSDSDARHVVSVDAWRGELGAGGRLLPALRLDVHDADWGPTRYDAVFCANMIHIAPWSATAALIAGAARVLNATGALCLYGPFHRGGTPTSASNAAFDADLRTRDARWGVRDLDDVSALAATAGLKLDEVVAMPANNLMVRFTR